MGHWTRERKSVAGGRQWSSVLVSAPQTTLRSPSGGEAGNGNHNNSVRDKDEGAWW